MQTFWNTNSGGKSDIIYSRDVSGRELAVYENNSLKQWNLFGLDNIGYMTGSDELRFYLKDHLGSVRVVTDDKSSVINCQDYDPWGYLLENRVYKSDENVYKFTSKERDEESSYDYSYARNYNSRIGIFNSSEPIPSSSYGWGSYVYCANNPLRIIDPSGKEWYYIYDDPEKGSWKFYEDQKEMDVWIGNYDEKGNKIIEKKQGYKELLFFQGSELQWLMESGERLKYNGVSGILDQFGKTQPKNADVPFEGPIPEGWWIVDPQNAYSQDKDAQSMYDKFSWYFHKMSRGEQFINIYPTGDNPTLRIEGFSIHGGIYPGSAGCVDLTSSMPVFFNAFMSHNKSMLLNVKY